MSATLSHTEIRKLMRQIDAIEKRSQVNNMVPEAEAARLLNLSVASLRNKVYAKQIDDYYTESPVNGERFYYKDKILGL